MNEFVRCIIKLVIIFSAVALMLLLGFVALLIFAPEILIKILYVAILIACVIGIVYLLFGLISTAVIYIIAKKKHSKLLGK